MQDPPQNLLGQVAQNCAEDPKLCLLPLPRHTGVRYLRYLRQFDPKVTLE